MDSAKSGSAANMVVLVDENDQEIGVAQKIEAHQEGLLHRAFSVFVFNSAGELLLQQRAYHKYHSGGLFTNSCCSHPEPGETTEAAAHRRLAEEMGIDCELRWAFPLRYNAAFDNGLVENEYDHVFIGWHDGAIHPNTDEVAGFKWVTPDALREWVTRSPDRFTVWFRLSFERAVDAANEAFP